MEKSTGHIIPHTHWDREWRYPIWKTHMLLIEFFAELLDTLDADPEYQCFLLDGQCSPIEDYLEVVPSDRERVIKHVKAGRIAIGPWYTLPDLYPVDGECLVRNLLKGIRTSKALGKTLDVAYMTFGWGQTAQLPQIYAKFGFDFIICAKKVSEERAPYAEFMWESPDGTKVLTSRLGSFARSNFFFSAYINSRYDVEFLGNDFRYSPEVTGLAYHKADAASQSEDFFLIKDNQGFYPERIKAGLKEAIERTDDTLLPEHRLFLNGCDFSSAQPDLSNFIKTVNETAGDEMEFKNSTLSEYAEILKEEIDYDKMPTVKGELRDGPSCDCSGNALATRIYIKQLNKKAQNALLRKAEPLLSLLSMNGINYNDVMLAQAWQYLFESHPHDSINGVTQDKTADDVEFRLNQALEISDVLFERGMGDLLKQIDLSTYDINDQLLVVFNPLPYAVTDMAKVCITLPRKQQNWDFLAEDEAGNRVPFQSISRDEHTYPVHDLNARPWPYDTDRHIGYIECCDIPAYGYKVFHIKPKSTFPRDWNYWYPMRTNEGHDLAASSMQLENEYLKVVVNADGTFNLTEKATGKTYTDLHYFEDAGDVGNYWAYYPPYNNQIHTSKGSPSRIWLEENGPLAATIAIEKTMTIPAHAEEPEFGFRGESKRNPERVDMVITSRLTLKKGSAKLDICTKVTNTAAQHRLRVALPTGIEAEYSAASGHFTVDERPVKPVHETEDGYYPEMQTLPMQHFVDVSDKQDGLALVSDSFTEYELADDADRTLYLTLFRSTGNMIVTGWRAVNRFPEQTGSQVKRDFEFNYAIYPHKGDWQEGNVYAQAEPLNVPLYPMQTTGHKLGSLPRENSLFSIEPANLILSALKKSEDRDSYILRLFNPTHEMIAGTIQFHAPVKEAYQVTLDEIRGDALALRDAHTIEISVAHHEILTLEVTGYPCKTKGENA